MKPRTLTLLGSLMLILTNPTNASTDHFEPILNMEEEIATNIIKTLETGWNNSDGNHFAIPFAESSEFVDIRGTHHTNAQPSDIGDAHQQLFNSIYKGSSVSYKLIHAMAIDQKTILANVSAELNAPTGPLAGVNASTITMVLIQVKGEWRIKAFHNTMVIKR